MKLLRLTPDCVIAPELIAAARLGHNLTAYTVEVLMPMGSAWVPIYHAAPDSVGNNQRHLEDAQQMLALVLTAMEAA